jgi:hypothetical protein
MSAKGTLRYAQEFLESADILQPRASNALSRFRSDHEVSIPVYYLLCHAIELSLKAYLSHVGYSEKELSGRNKQRGIFGHNLLALYDAALKEGLSDGFSPLDRRLLELITPYFVSKRIEYFYRGVATYPKHSLLGDFATRILGSVRTALK